MGHEFGDERGGEVEWCGWGRVGGRVVREVEGGWMGFFLFFDDLCSRD